MPVHNFAAPRGRLEEIEIDSRALAGNLVGDPTRRRVAVYLPAGYDETGGEYPLFVGLAGFTGSGLKLLGWKSFGETLPQRLDRLVAAGEMGPVVLALPDAFTSLGGNQYVDTPVLGHWKRYLLEEMIPALETRYRVRRDAAGRAVFGHSSGGYGALVQALDHGDRWGAVAAHSADVAFEWVYLADMPKALDALAGHGGDVEAFVRGLREAPSISGNEFYALMLLAMAASYDPDPSRPLGVRLPVDPHTCTLIEERWQAWLQHDPLRMADDPHRRRRLEGLGTLFLDCGFRDEYGLHYGNRALARKLTDHGVAHTYEEFDGGHSGVDHRMDRSLPLLYRAVGGGV